MGSCAGMIDQVIIEQTEARLPYPRMITFMLGSACENLPRVLPSSETKFYIASRALLEDTRVSCKRQKRSLVRVPSDLVFRRCCSRSH